MSKIEELIKRHCPDGVNFYPLGEVCTVVRGASPRPIKNFITEEKDGVNWIKIGDVAVGSKYITSCAERITKEGSKKSRFVKKGDFILSNSMSFGRPYILEIDGCIHDGWLAISDFEDKMLADYLYYVLVSGNIQREMEHRASFGGAVQNLNADIVRALEIPVPPIEVQYEIVRILDKFTEIETELQTELEARKRQYKYYSELLFATSIDKEKWISVRDAIVSLKTGLNPRQNFVLNAEGASLYYITGKDITNNAINISERTDLISQEDVNLINKRACLEENDVLFVSTGTGTVGRMAVVSEYNNDWAVSETMYCLKPKKEVIYSEYLMYVLYSPNSIAQFSPRITKGSVPHLKVNDLLDVKIPVPTMEEQMHIISKIKKFDKICNDVETGLPVEIEARHKQYEYYRDKLLTFERKVV